MFECVFDDVLSTRAAQFSVWTSYAIEGVDFVDLCGADNL